MNTKEISFAEIKKNLFSADNELIHSAIIEIRNNGSVEMLELLFELLIKSTDISAKKDILICISDLKDKNSLPFLISAIKDSQYSSIKKDLLNAYWQTNFDFSPYSDLFVDILIQDDFESGIEALTIIENIAETFEESKKIEIYNLIKKNIPLTDSHKKDLLEAALHILE